MDKVQDIFGNGRSFPVWGVFRQGEIILNIWKGIIDCQSNIDRTVICYARFEVLTLVLMKIHVFWDVTILIGKL